MNFFVMNLVLWSSLGNYACKNEPFCDESLSPCHMILTFLDAIGPDIDITPITEDTTLFEGSEFRRICRLRG